MAQETAGIVSTADAVELLLLGSPAELAQLARDGWFSPVSRDRWRMDEIVQGYIRALRAGQDNATREEMAGMLDMTTRQLSILVGQGVLPKAKNRFYTKAATVRQYVRHLVERAESGASDYTLAKQRARLTRSKADIAEMTRGRLLGELLPANEALASWSQLVVAFRTRVMAIPSKCAARLVMVRTAAQAKAILEPECREALEDIEKADIKNIGSSHDQSRVRVRNGNGRAQRGKARGAAADLDGEQLG